jgi:hypothetical protein
MLSARDDRVDVTIDMVTYFAIAPDEKFDRDRAVMSEDGYRRRVRLCYLPVWR